MDNTENTILKNNETISLNDYSVWLEKNWKDISDLQYGDPKNVDVQKKAEKLYWVFNAFYYHFKEINDNYTLVCQDYSLWKDVFNQILPDKSYLGNNEFYKNNITKINETLKQIENDPLVKKQHYSYLDYINQSLLARTERMENYFEYIDRKHFEKQNKIAILAPAIV